MADLHQARVLLLDNGRRDGKVWSVLQPQEIDMSAAIGDGRIAVLLIFGSKLEPEFAPAIETADGPRRRGDRTD